MVLLRPQTLLAAFGKPMPRNNLGAKGVQIYGPGAMFWSKKALIIRNAPYTIENPTLGQIETRLQFAALAREAKERGLTKGFYRGLPGAAGYIQEVMKDYRAADSLAPEEYPSRVKRSFHTEEELRRMLEEKARGRREELARIRRP